MTLKALGYATTAFGILLVLGVLWHWFTIALITANITMWVGGVLSALGVLLVAVALRDSPPPLTPRTVQITRRGTVATTTTIQGNSPEDRLTRAVALVVGEDRELMRHNVNERSISHRLAMYLADEFPEWDVDCEFNRNHDDPKRLEFVPESVLTTDTNARTVYPDIIVHTRGTDDNLMVIEVKKSTNREPIERDIRKLRLFLRQLKYKHAALVWFAAGEAEPEMPASIQWVDET